MFLNPSSKEYTDVTDKYEELWKQRDELEDEIFGIRKGSFETDVL